MAEEEKEDLRTERWKEKSGWVPGLTADTDIPETRYQVLQGQVYGLTRFRDGSTARSFMTVAELEAQLGQSVTKEGWYDPLGKYYGADDPQFTETEE